MKRLLLVSLLVGCAPQDADVTGNWFTWLAANSSATVAEEGIEDIRDNSTIFECKRGWDSDTEDWELGYIGPRQEDNAGDERFVGGDCDPDDSDCAKVQEQLQADCDEIDALEYYTFLQDDGYYGLSGKIEAWRTEAFLNGEGDLQLTVHTRLGNGQDFRFSFSIMPDFAPVECTTDEAGNPVIEYVDGAAWLDKWSEDEEGYDIYYLNAGGAQQNPANDDDFWFLITDWSSGAGQAKFGAEEFLSDPGFWQDGNTLLGELGLEEMDRFEPDPSLLEPAYDEFQIRAATWSEEISGVAGAKIGEEPAFVHKIETNDWRPIDASDSGFDGWIEMYSSWVRVKNGSTFEKGGAVSGDYQIMYQGFESGSQLMVTGTFDIPKLREDPWAYTDLEDDKREENETPFCGGASYP